MLKEKDEFVRLWQLDEKSIFRVAEGNKILVPSV